MTINCPRCSHLFEGNDSLAGTTVECPQCGNTFILPSLTAPMTTARTNDVAPVKRKGNDSINIYGTVSCIVSTLVLLFLVYHGNLVRERILRHRREKKEATMEYRKRREADWLYHNAMNYYDGNGVMQDYTKALELLNEASDMGSSAAYGQLAYMYLAGAGGVQKDTTKALKYALLAPEEDLSNLVLGECYLFGFNDSAGGQIQDFTKAYECYSKISHRYYGAMFFKGLMLYHGVGVEKDRLKAAETFYDCCKNKGKTVWESRAALCLGYMYWKGLGVGENKALGEAWMKWGWPNAGQCQTYPGKMDLQEEAVVLFMSKWIMR